MSYKSLLECLGYFLMTVAVLFLLLVGWSIWVIIAFVLGLILSTSNLDIGKGR